MHTEATRALLQEWMTAQGQRDAATMRSLLTVDATMRFQTTAAVEDLSGRDAIASALASGAIPKALGLDVTTFVATPGRLLVDGSTAALELAVTARTLAGDAYENEYVFLYEFTDDGLAEIREYGDTLAASRQLPEAFPD